MAAADGWNSGETAVIHYHGTPLTPRSVMRTMAGKHFCVSFANPGDGDWCLEHGQSVMWDNGAFSFHTKGRAVDWSKYYGWLEPRLGHPHWAVVPDVIDGLPSENLALANEWPHRADCAAPVWHLAEPIGQLFKLLEIGFSRVCFGSSGRYWQVGSDPWCRRADEAFNALAKNGNMPWVHMLRGLALSGDRWPFASADSTNVARNYNSAKFDPERVARRIDSVQCPIKWEPRPLQETLFA